MDFPTPGSLLHLDFRCGAAAPQRPSPTIKLLQWNIERGYQLEGIIQELKGCDADIISLQEVDVGCERSGGTDTGRAIAEALKLNYVFLCEFEELHSPLRDARSQGGGVHGNAILSKFDLSDLAVVEHRMHPVDWNNPTHPLAKKEPRRGRRAVLRSTAHTPQGPLVVYCPHLEVFCGMLARISQLADVFEDARAMVCKGYVHQCILGDLNTMAHGIARLSPNYCCDRMRLRSLGMDEAVVWERYVLSVPDPAYQPARDSSWASVAGKIEPAGPEGAPARTAGTVAGAAALAGSSSSSSSSSEEAAAAEQQDAAADAAMLAEELRVDREACAALQEGARGAEAKAGLACAAAADAAATDARTEPPWEALAAADAAAGSGGAGSSGSGGSGTVPALREAVNLQLVKWGLSLQTAREALNPGFWDPFPAATTVTLDNPAYRWLGVSLMRGKLDWALLRRLAVHGMALGNDAYAHSDHRWMAAEVVLE